MHKVLGASSTSWSPCRPRSRRPSPSGPGSRRWPRASPRRAAPRRASFGAGFLYPAALGRAQAQGALLPPRRGLRRRGPQHGPLALVEARDPHDRLLAPGASYERSLSNIAEVRARRGPVIAVCPGAPEGLRRRSTSSSPCRPAWRSSPHPSSSCPSSFSRARSRARSAATWTGRATWPRASRLAE